jgi:acetyl coenzyme A synthetase (ADP forming)-like protein
MNLSKLFDPSSIAVIGASADKTKVGYALTFNLARDGRKRIYPVNPNHSEIIGLPCYPSVLKINGRIDLALIAVKAEIVPQMIEECAKKKIRNVVVISAGFKETSEAGAALEARVKRMAKEKKINLLGPNCLGIIDPHTNLNASFSPGKPMAGHIAFVSQSGALGTAMLDWAIQQDIGFSKFVSLGNEAGLTEVDILEYLAADKETKAILVYLEKISDGRTFIDTIKKITPKKPVVVIKAGRSERGKTAVMSHTGSLAPDDAVFLAACRSANIIVAESIREFYTFAKIFSQGVFRPLKKLIVLTNGGGPSVIAADLISLSRSLEMAELSEETKTALRKVLPPTAALNNPVDIIGDALANRYEAALDILVSEKNADGIIVIVTPQFMTEIEKTAKIIADYSRKKTIIPIFMGGETIVPALKILQKGGLQNIAFAKDIVEILDAFALGPSKGKTVTERIVAADKEAVPLGFIETQKTLKRYGLKPVGEIAKNRQELENLLKRTAYPIVMKIISPDIIHKTERGAVKLNINNVDEAEKFWQRVVADKDLRFEGVLVQPMIRGREVIVGLKQDPTFGPIVVFGLGGVFTELLKDVAMRVAPVDKKTAHQMIGEIKGHQVLEGFRGNRPVNFAALEKIIVAISKLALANPTIKEIDLNPVIANEKGAFIVDARFLR